MTRNCSTRKRVRHSQFPDDDMFDDSQNVHCNSSCLSENLGQVRYIFSDKTGTLTKNEMILKFCHVWNTPYRRTDSMTSSIELKGTKTKILPQLEEEVQERVRCVVERAAQRFRAMSAALQLHRGGQRRVQVRLARRAVSGDVLPLSGRNAALQAGQRECDHGQWRKREVDRAERARVFLRTKANVGVGVQSVAESLCSLLERRG